MICQPRGEFANFKPFVYSKTDHHGDIHCQEDKWKTAFCVELQTHQSRSLRGQTRQANLQDKLQPAPGTSSSSEFDRLFQPGRLCDVIYQGRGDDDTALATIPDVEDRQLFIDALGYFETHPIEKKWFIHLIHGRLCIRLCEKNGYCITLHDCSAFMNDKIARCMMESETEIRETDPLVLPPNAKAFALDKKIFLEDYDGITTTTQQMQFFKVFFERGVFLEFLKHLYTNARPQSIGRRKKKPSLKRSKE